MRTGLLAAVAALTIAGMADAGHADGFTLTSDEIQPGQTIGDEHAFSGAGCTGGNISPSLHWSGAPPGTKSYAVTVRDRDARNGAGWWHWTMFNISAATTDLPKGAGDPTRGLAPKGAVQTRSDFGTKGWGGPCPPPGEPPHHYDFLVHALDTDALPMDDDSDPGMVGFDLPLHTLGTATLTGIYGR